MLIQILTLENQEKLFQKVFSQLDELFSFWENYGKCPKTFGHQTFSNKKKKKTSGSRSKLSYYTVLHRKCVECRNDKKLEYP